MKLLMELYGYHAWADNDLLGKLKQIDENEHRDELASAIKLISHYFVVSKIFSAHLQQVSHSYKTDNLEEQPSLEWLTNEVKSIDQWYVDFVRNTSQEALSKPIYFVFTDGDKGCMTCEEMLLHVALHAGYHRAEVGQLLRKVSITPPWDTFAVYLHQTGPERRSSEAV